MGLSIYIYFPFELTTRRGKTDESAAEEVVYNQDEVKPAHPAQIEIVCRDSMFSHGTRVKVPYWKQFMFLAVTRIEKLRYFFFNLGEKRWQISSSI